jgi:hypothetical protein
VWSSGVIGACQGAHALTQAHSHPHARTHGQADAIEASDKKGLGDAATDELPVMGPSSDDYYPCATGGLPPTTTKRTSISGPCLTLTRVAHTCARSRRIGACGISSAEGISQVCGDLGADEDPL